MAELIACLSTGKGTWSHVSQLIESPAFSKIFLLTNEFGMTHFKPHKKVELIQINPDAPVKELSQDIRNKLKGRLTEPEVHVNFISGSGHEHMALLSALLSLGVGIRLTALNTIGEAEEL